MLDIESVIDWILIKGLSGDKDYYPNVAFFRSEGTDGLWRMAAWDFDWGFSFPFCNLTSPSDELYYSIQLGNLLSSLFSYEPFRIQFLERLREALALSYTKENILAKMDAYETLLASEVALDWSHWNVNIAKWDRLREEYRNIVSKGIWHKQILPGVANLPGIRRMNPASYMTENK